MSDVDFIFFIALMNEHFYSAMLVPGYRGIDWIGEIAIPYSSFGYI